MEEEGCKRVADMNEKVAKLKGRVAGGLQIGRGGLQAFGKYTFYLDNSTETDLSFGRGGLQRISKFDKEGCRRAVIWNTQTAEQTDGLRQGRGSVARGLQI